MYDNRMYHLVIIALAMVFATNTIGEEIVLGPASQPRGPNTQPIQVPLETIQRTFNQSVDQAQKAEASGTETNLQRAMALYRKAQTLAAKHPELQVSSATLSEISERLQKLPDRLAEVRRQKAEADAGKRQAQQNARAQQREANTRNQQITVGGMPAGAAPSQVQSPSANQSQIPSNNAAQSSVGRASQSSPPSKSQRSGSNATGIRR